MKIRKSVLTLTLAIAVVFGIMVGASAADTLKTITASLNYGITIKYNGDVQEMKDASGNRVYPISYEGTTYLPVRAIANLLGIEVNWDGPTNTVWLGEGFDAAPVQQPEQTGSDSSNLDSKPLDESQYPAGTVVTAKTGQTYTATGSFLGNRVICTDADGFEWAFDPDTGSIYPPVPTPNPGP